MDLVLGVQTAGTTSIRQEEEGEGRGKGEGTSKKGRKGRQGRENMDRQVVCDGCEGWRGSGGVGGGGSCVCMWGVSVVFARGSAGPQGIAPHRAQSHPTRSTRFTYKSP